MAFRFVRTDDRNRSEQNIEACLERYLYKLCGRTGEGAETQVGGQFQKFCVRCYRNNEIYSNTTVDIPECSYVCPLLHVIPATAHTLLQSTYNGMERNRAEDENREKCRC